ncbi:MAG TPA: hypothetical protein VFK38_09895 [Candidatus Limnocylindrales bacterium]|nr:hypothetical protein [Candidatus Limnocylindrales bacterium]
MTDGPLAFFTLDRGTATTAASLLARVEGRFRLLASLAVPTGMDVESLLGSLVETVRGAAPELLDGADDWREWARLECLTHAPGRIVLAAVTERRLAALETAAANAGWEIAGRISPERTDALDASTLLLQPDLDLVAVAAGDPPAVDERERLSDLGALVAAAIGERDDLLCLLAGGAASLTDLLPAQRVLLGPAPDGRPAAEPSPLGELLEQVAARRLPPGLDGAPSSDGRQGFAHSVVSLAALLERRVEGVDVGRSGGMRVLATADGLRARLVRADGALVPDGAPDDDHHVDDVLRWSPVPGDLSALRDRVRNLRLAPWRDASGDGARLRLAAARAALARLDAAWQLADEADGRPGDKAADVLIASGGAFDVAPPPAVGLALVDTLRRPGGIGLYHDHARLLGPLGTLASERDRRRLLADLLEDALVPLGSAVVAAGLRQGRHAGTLRVSSDGSTSELELVPGAIQLIDLPPGLAATVELETREGVWLGVRARRIALHVVGGLCGLLVDTRDVPLRLPERAERRRELLDAWQRPLWPVIDG